MNKIIKNKSKYTHLVDRCDWTAVLSARRSGVPWQELRTSHGMPAIIRAVIDGSPIIISRILELEPPINGIRLTNGTWMSPLWAALDRKQTEIVKILLEAGADPNLGPKKFEKPLVWASKQQMVEAVIELLKFGAKPHPDNGKSAPLNVWMNNLHEDFSNIYDVVLAINSLLKSGAMPNNNLLKWLPEIENKFNANLFTQLMVFNKIEQTKNNINEIKILAEKYTLNKTLSKQEDDNELKTDLDKNSDQKSKSRI
jgi:ankyrin repeat protein